MKDLAEKLFFVVLIIAVLKWIFKMVNHGITLFFLLIFMAIVVLILLSS